MTDEEYRGKLKEYQQKLEELHRLTVDSGTHRLIPKDRLDTARFKAVDDWLNDFQRTMPKYKIVCTRESYVGQGVTWMPGDVYAVTSDPDYAQGIVTMFDNDSWVGPGAWKIERLEPDGKLLYD